MEKILHTFFSCFEHYKWQSKLGILFCGKALKWHAGLISFKSIDLQHKKATFTNDHLSRNYLLNIFSFNASVKTCRMRGQMPGKNCLHL